MNTLTRSLRDYPPAMLRAIADANRVALASNAVQAMADQLAAALTASEHLADLLAGCSEAARTALAVLLHNGGRSPALPFERRFGAIRQFGPGRLERERPQRAPLNAAEELWYRGLVYRAFAQTPDGVAEFLYVPGDLIPLLPQPEPVTTSFSVCATSSPPAVEPTADSLLHDVCTILCFVQTGRARLAESDNLLAWSANTLYELSRHLLQPAVSPDEIVHAGPGSVAALAWSLAIGSGWLRASGRRVQLAPGAVRGWLEAERGQQRRALLEAWRSSATWNDLCRTPGLACEQTGSWANDPVTTRERVLALLASLPPDQWYPLDDFVAAVKLHAPDFQRPDGDYDTWYVRRRQDSSFLRGFEAWDEVEGALLRFMLAGPLRWLGAVDLGAAAPSVMAGGCEAFSPGPATVFQLTPAGIAWLTDAPPPAEPAADALTVHPDFLITAPAGASLMDRFRVSRFTTWEPATAGIDGIQFHYRISQSGLRRAAAQRIDTARIVAFLNEHAAQPIPGNVLAALERWPR